ncbi:MAG: enoyl-CoA hydratase-related protein, partial [Dehalococcoidia bacterium]|nr:enoyl-CoA hydratase-related protein [Dehalococcoidia bacterium]
MADQGVKLFGPSGLHYSELHKPVETGRDAQQEGPVVAVDTYEDGKIYVITLNRPHRMNSIGGGLPQALTDAFAEFRDDRKARVAILTGRG